MSFLTDVVANSASVVQPEGRTGRAHSDELKHCLLARRVCQCPEERKHLSRRVYELMKQETAAKLNLKLDQITTEGRGRKALKEALQKPFQKKWIAAVVHPDGLLKNTRNEVCEVFTLFMRTCMVCVVGYQDECDNLRMCQYPFLATQLGVFCKTMKNRRTCSLKQ